VEMVLARLPPARHGIRSPDKGDSTVAVPVDRAATPVWGVEIGDGQARPRLMVVEDDEDFAHEIGEALLAQGYEVVTFAFAETAIEAARNNPPALLLLDVHLPDTDGFMVAMELADDRRTAAVPVLFISADETLAVRVRGFREGEADFLRKPFELDDLLTRVDACLVRAERRNRLRRTARIDELTGLGNVRFLEERLIVESSRLARYGTSLAIVVGDVDGLKTINDTQGHPAGSAVLRAIGEALSLEIRDTDLAVRYGGDEFVVLLPHTGLPEATRFAERLLARIRRLRPCGLTVSISLGVAAFDEQRDASVRDLLERADRAAYRAKRDGGDRILADSSTTGASAA